MHKNLSGFESQMDEAQVVNFEQFLGLLLKWNRAFNLTAINDPIEVYEKHFADSAVPLQFIEKGSTLVDIGTGAGFPGIPIKILRSDVDVTLVEATSKKANFCDHAIRALKLKKIRIIIGRVEDQKIVKLAGKYDCVISRATLKLPNYLKVGPHYLKNGGKLIAMLGPSWPDEFDTATAQMKKSGLKLAKVHEYVLPVSQAKRAILIFEKR